MADHAIAGVDKRVQLLSLSRGQIDATMAAVTVFVHGSTEIGLPIGIVQADCVAIEGHPVLNG